MPGGTNQKPVNSTQKADQPTTVAQLKVTIQQQKETIKRLKAANVERLRLYIAIEEKAEVLQYVRLTSAQVAILLNIGTRQVRRLYREGKLKGFQWSEQGQIQFSLPDIIAYMDSKYKMHIGKGKSDSNQLKTA